MSDPGGVRSGPGEEPDRSTPRGAMSEFLVEAVLVMVFCRGETMDFFQVLSVCFYKII